MSHEEVGEGKNVLTEDEAKLRSSVISNVAYDLALDIQSGQKQYSGILTITFDFKGQKDGTFLDFVGKEITKLDLNGTSLPSKDLFKENRIHLPQDALKSSNTLLIHYTNDFDHSGEGFHQFIDPEDNQEYLYTNFEPFEAHRLLPCFDQPDIKATYSVTVTAPSEWEIIANNPVEATTPVPNDPKRSTRKFKKTPSFSTYLLAVIAGPYESYVDSVTVRGKEIPLRFLCRKSLTKYLKPDVEELMTITKNGMHCFSEFFDYVYPFEKYDQIFVPEYNQGAMENIGAITFTERYVFRETPTEARRCTRADTVLHEMAHQWFGNLVSPVWWDGLWLNESFATYMAAYAVAMATKFGQLSWQEFNSSMKRWAEREDQQSTTHPIQGSVVDTDATFLSFDGITYGKGASVLKQLVAVIGEDSFKLGMQHYFKKHEYGNTTIKDFLSALEHGYTQTVSGAHIDLTRWASYWLETSGINTLAPKIQTENGKITHFAIEQSPMSSEHSTLRPHTVEIAFFVENNNTVTLQKTVIAQVTDQPISEISDYSPDADFIFINYNDHAYAKIFLEKSSLTFVLKNLEKFENALLRQLLWNTLWHMVRDGVLKATEFVNLVREKIPFEKSLKLVQSVVGSVEGALHYYTPNKFKQEQYDNYFQFALQQFKTVQDRDSQIVWGHNTINTSMSKKNVSLLIDMMGQTVNGFEFDQAMRWNIVTRAMAFDIENAEQLVLNEEKRDPSDRGIRAATSARSALPTVENKAKMWERIKNDKESSLHIMTSVMSGFRWWHQSDLLKPYTEKYFQEVRAVNKERQKEFATGFIEILFPNDPENGEIFKKTEEVLKSLTPEEKVLQRYLQENLDDLKRAKIARQTCLN